MDLRGQEREAGRSLKKGQLRKNVKTGHKKSQKLNLFLHTTGENMRWRLLDVGEDDILSSVQFSRH